MKLAKKMLLYCCGSSFTTQLKWLFLWRLSASIEWSCCLFCFYFGKEKRLKKAGNHEVWCPTRSWTLTAFCQIFRKTIPRHERWKGMGHENTSPLFLFWKREKTEQGGKSWSWTFTFFCQNYRKTIMVHMDFENTLESNKLDDVLKSK